MAWTVKQQRFFMKASSAAGWNDQQRYVCMAHVGCPLEIVIAKPGAAGVKRPSVKHLRNSQESFEFLMALAESHAGERGRGDKIPSPQLKNGRSWREVTQRASGRMLRHIESIAAEAVERLPEKFTPGFLPGFIMRQTMNDAPGVGFTSKPSALVDCDEGQLYRVLEGLKAWVARELRARDLVARSFTMSGRRSIKEAA